MVYAMDIRIPSIARRREDLIGKKITHVFVYWAHRDRYVTVVEDTQTGQSLAFIEHVFRECYGDDYSIHVYVPEGTYEYCAYLRAVREFMNIDTSHLIKEMEDKQDDINAKIREGEERDLYNRLKQKYGDL